MRERHASTASRLDADRVEARGDPHARQVRRFAENVTVVGSETFRTIKDQAKASIVENRDTIEGVRKILGQMVRVGVETDERLVGRWRADGWPWVGDRLE